MHELTPELSQLLTEFPGWPTTLAFAAAYLGGAFAIHLVIRLFLGRDGRRRIAARAAALEEARTPGREAILESYRRYIARLHRATLGFSRLVLVALGLILLVADLFPSLDVLSSSLGALLVTAGTLGFAGALQPFLRDAVGGAILMAEDPYAAGDIVRVGGVEGVVQSVHLRRTVLRSSDGALHEVPNGMIGIATNLSRASARTLVELLLAHEVDLDRAIAVADEAADALAADPAWADRIVETPRVVGVSNVSAAGVTIRIAGRTSADQASKVAGELRRRIRAAYLEQDVPLARRSSERP